MKHYDENILELFALKSEKVANQREEIEAHLMECYSCNELLDSITQFYKAVETNSAVNLSDQKLLDSKSLVIKPGFQTQKARSPFLSGRVLTKAIFYYRMYPARVGISVLALTFLVLVGINPKFVFKSSTPESYRMNYQQSRLEIFNEKNEDYLDISYSCDSKELARLNSWGIRQTEIVDLHNDGKKEIVSVIPTQGLNDNERSFLKIYDNDGSLILSKKIGPTNFSFNQQNFSDEFATRSLLITNDIYNNRKNIFVGTHHRNSPFLLTRFDENGNIIGEYWHYGQFWGINNIDIDNDGRNEILLCGVDDVVERPCLVILDPSKIVGETQSKATQGFGYKNSEAELHYVTFNDISEQVNLKLFPRLAYLISQNSNEIKIAYAFYFKEKFLVVDVTLSDKLEITAIRPTDASGREFQSIAEGIEIPQNIKIVSKW